MENKKCVICNRESTEILRSYGDIGIGDCTSINNQLSVIFLLRKCVLLPQKICVKLLKEFGNPCLWVSWCDSCSELVERGKAVYEDIEKLKIKFQNIRVELKHAVTLSEKGQSTSSSFEPTRKRNSGREPIEVVRCFIKQAKYKKKRRVNPERKLLHTKIEMPDNFEEMYDPFFALEADVGISSQLKVKTENENQSDSGEMSEFSNYIAAYSSDNDSVSPPRNKKKSKKTKRPGIKKNVSLVEVELIGHLPCSVCEKKFSKMKNLKKHFRLHSGPNMHCCRWCEQKFETFSELLAHREIHKGTKRELQCPYCRTICDSPSKLKRHMLTHTKERPFICPTCGKGFSQSITLKKHERAVHIKEKSNLCAQCGRGFSDRSSYLRHVRITHSGEKPFSCSYCGKACATSDYLKSHERIHTGEKPYNCRVCGQAFSQYSSMRTHEKSVHKLVQSYSRPTNETGSVGIGNINYSVINNEIPNSEIKNNDFINGGIRNNELVNININSNALESSEIRNNEFLNV